MAEIAAVGLQEQQLFQQTTEGALSLPPLALQRSWRLGGHHSPQPRFCSAATNIGFPSFKGREGEGSGTYLVVKYNEVSWTK